MAKGKLERKFKLIYEGRELSSWLSEAGKYDAFQILVQKFGSGVEVQSILMKSLWLKNQRRNDGNLDWSCVFLRTWLLFLLNVQLF